MAGEPDGINCVHVGNELANAVLGGMDRLIDVPNPGPAGGPDVLITVKPELMVGAFAIIKDRFENIARALTRHPLKIHGIAYLSSPTLVAGDIVAALYPVLSGWSSLGDTATLRRADLDGLFKGTEILAAELALARYTHLTPEGLASLFDGGPSRKLANGVYARTVRIGSDQLVVVNGFFPAMAKRLQAPLTGLVGFHCSTNVPLQYIHRGVVGAIDPEMAASGSLRSVFARAAGETADNPLTKAENGFHVSPGPIEGLWQVAAVFGYGVGSSRFRELSLPCQLRRLGIPESMLLNTSAANSALESVTRLYSADEDGNLLTSARLISTFK